MRIPSLVSSGETSIAGRDSPPAQAAGARRSDSGAATRFCATFIVALVVATSLVGGVNALIDPYALFGTSRIDGLNARKPMVERHTEMTKTYQIEQMRPTTVLLGSSRIDTGLDPQSPLWPSALQPVFNYGVPLASPVTMLNNLREAVALGNLRLAIVGLDLEGFLAPRDAQETDPAIQDLGIDEGQRRLLVTPGHTWQRGRDLFYALFTMTALEDSLGTIQGQYHDIGDETERGATTEASFAAEAREYGFAGMFADKNTIYGRSMARAQLDVSANAPGFAAVAEMIRLCREHKVQLILTLTPEHADRLETVADTGLWSQMEAWKARLTAMAAAAPEPDGSPMPLIDFARYDRYTTEAVPLHADAAPMRWFWDSSHFDRALGEKMLARVLGAGEPEFGRDLTAAALPDALASDRAAELAYRRNAPEQVGFIEASLRGVMK